jgi:GxxExxY protein
LSLRGIRASAQAPLAVNYKGDRVGEYFADILVEDALAIELKCADRLAREHTAQCLNYLRASGLRLCLLVNFQSPKVEWKRVIYGFPAPDRTNESAVAVRELG